MDGRTGGAACLAGVRILDLTPFKAGPSCIEGLAWHPGVGPFKPGARPIRHSGSPSAVGPVPLPGQHIDGVLRSRLKLNPDDIGTLRSGGVIGCQPAKQAARATREETV